MLRLCSIEAGLEALAEALDIPGLAAFWVACAALGGRRAAEAYAVRAGVATDWARLLAVAASTAVLRRTTGSEHPWSLPGKYVLFFPDDSTPRCDAIPSAAYAQDDLRGPRDLIARPLLSTSPLVGPPMVSPSSKFCSLF